MFGTRFLKSLLAEPGSHRQEEWSDKAKHLDQCLPWLAWKRWTCEGT